MSHIDDGLLHAYLDGALHAEDPAEAERVERHLAVCDDCRARLAAARRLRAEADVLLEAATPTDLDMPPFEAIAERARERAAEPGGSQPRGAHEAPSDADVHGVADARTTRRRRYTRTRTLAWAASIVMALGMGWWARELAFQPGSLPQSPAEQLQGVSGTTRALETAAPSAKTRAATPAGGTLNAAQSPTAPKQAAYEAKRAPAAAAQPTTTAGRGTAADQQAAGAAPRQPVAGRAPAAQQPKAPPQEPSKTPEAESRARKVEGAAASPAPDLPTAVAQSNAMSGMTPSIATDAVMRGTNLGGTKMRLLTVDEASAWLGGPVYGVGGLDVLGVVPYNTPAGVRAVTVYQRLSSSDTLGLHQLRPASGSAFTLGPDVTGVIRNGTLIYARTGLPPDSLQALLRRLVPLRH